MKKYSIYIIISLLTFKGLLCQPYTEVIIKTPLCHQPNEWRGIRDFTWSDDKIDDCKELWLYDGGILSGTITKSLSSYYFSGEEKNTYLPTHECICLAINGGDIFLGTENEGLFKGTYNTGNGNVSWENATTYSEFDNKTINDIFISDDLWIICTELYGLYISTDDGVSWNRPQSLIDKTVTSIIKIGTDFYVSLSSGGQKVYKSNNGLTWTGLSLYPKTYCLSYDNDNNNYIYAGTESGLHYSTNSGANWSSMTGTGNWEISAILNYNDYIFIGLYDNVALNPKYCIKYYYNNNWYDGDIPNFTNVRINDFIEYEISSVDYILAATANGIYCDELDSDPADSWSKANQLRGSVSPKEETRIKKLYIYNNELWFVSSGGDLWDNAIVIENVGENDPTIPSKWNNFTCVVYAWHFTEGGITGCYLVYPNQNHYVKKLKPDDPEDDTYEINWDYFKAPIEDIESGSWDKVTMYNFSHSGIKSYLSPYPANPFVADSIRVISKWGVVGPLVEHYLLDNPFGEGTVRYWKSRKEISGVIDENVYNDVYEVLIGRQITTVGVTTIIPVPIPNPKEKKVDFYVAPMYDHQIHLTNGFHAEYGCEFHAYVKTECEETECQIPWEDYGFAKAVANNENEDIVYLLRNKNYDNTKLQLTIYPNPSSQKISILAKIGDYGNQCPINIKLYTFSGEIIRNVTVSNGVESNIDVEEISSGAYLIAAESEFINDNGKSVSISASEIIIIEK